MEAEKSGKVKLTVELEINQPAMDLIKMNTENMESSNTRAHAELERRHERKRHGHGHDAPRRRIK